MCPESSLKIVITSASYLETTIANCSGASTGHIPLLYRMERLVDWDCDFPFNASSCDDVQTLLPIGESSWVDGGALSPATGQCRLRQNFHTSSSDSGREEVRAMKSPLYETRQSLQAYPCQAYPCSLLGIVVHKLA